MEATSSWGVDKMFASQALHKNVHRAHFDYDQYAALIKRESRSRRCESICFALRWVLSGPMLYLVEARQEVIGRILQPPYEPASQQFWFEFFMCASDDGYMSFTLYSGMVGFGRLLTHVAVLPAPAFDVLLAIVSERERDEHEDMQEDDDFYCPGLQGNEWTIDMVRVWAEAHDFPRSVAPSERDAFLASLGRLEVTTKKDLSQIALHWVARCEHIPETAVRIGMALLVPTDDA